MGACGVNDVSKSGELLIEEDGMVLVICFRN